MRGRNAAWCVAASVAVAAVFGVQGSHMEMSDEDVNIWPAWHNCRRYLLVRDRLFPPPKGEVYLLWGVRGVDRSGASAWNEDDLGQVDLPVCYLPHISTASRYISLYLPIPRAGRVGRGLRRERGCRAAGHAGRLRNSLAARAPRRAERDPLPRQILRLVGRGAE